MINKTHSKEQICQLRLLVYILGSLEYIFNIELNIYTLLHISDCISGLFQYFYSYLDPLLVRYYISEVIFLLTLSNMNKILVIIISSSSQ